MSLNDASGFWNPRATDASIITAAGGRGASTTCRVTSPAVRPVSSRVHQSRHLLPITKHKHQILYAVEQFNVTVIVGETGSGKSTQVPQFLVQEGGWAGNDFQVVVTQPRRVAATELAKRVAVEMGTDQRVGYNVRFDSTVGPHCQIVYCTDGMLLQQATSARGDPLLSQYSVVMIDEAHERTLNSDALLGMLLKIRKKRPELRLIICSATIDAEQFLRFFTDNQSVSATGTIISVDGRQFPVETLYLSAPAPNYLTATIETVWKIHKATMVDSSPSSTLGANTNEANDVLCFLPTGEDIDEAIALVEEYFDRQRQALPKSTARASPVAFLPLYGNLPQYLQARVFQRNRSMYGKSSARQQRIIFATNIAETSVTVPGIRFVVDSGLVKLPFFDPTTGLERLLVCPISQASAAQRAGRAGRIQAGTVYRLYTEPFFRDQMPSHTPPEILRTNLTGFLLHLKALGVDNILAFDLIDVPNVEALKHGLESLYALGAIDDRTNITNDGLDMAVFPVEPRAARMLLESLALGCSWEVLAVASALQGRDLFQKPRGTGRRQQDMLDYESAMAERADASGDHVTYANLFTEMDDQGLTESRCRETFVNYLALKRGMEVRGQLASFLKRFGKLRAFGLVDSHGDARSTAIRRCVAAGFFSNIARLGNDGRYYTLRKRIPVTVNNPNLLGKEYLVFGETIDGAARGGIELKHVSAIDAQWLRQVAPHYWE
jgi:ATP-dependent RNA helicase DDX35